MYQPSFGVINPIIFPTPEIYYETLGFLAKSDGTSALTWENNHLQGARGPEGRIQCYSDIHKYPQPLVNKFTGGTGRAEYRINASDFVTDLIDNHSFQYGEVQNVAQIRNTIPANHLVDFDRGFNL